MRIEFTPYEARLFRGDFPQLELSLKTLLCRVCNGIMAGLELLSGKPHESVIITINVQDVYRDHPIEVDADYASQVPLTGSEVT